MFRLLIIQVDVSMVILEDMGVDVLEVMVEVEANIEVKVRVKLRARGMVLPL